MSGISPTRRDVLATSAAVSAVSLLSEHVAAADGSTIRPFRINVPEEALTDLRRRIAATRWPERETVTDASQGVQLATIQKLARYWATEYDWRKCEAKLNALPHFITEIDGLDIHFIHVRSKHENALPIIVTHGWPGSVVEQLKIIDPLDQSHRPWRERVGCLPRRDPVDAGLRLLGQADDHRLGPHPHRPRLDRADEAPRLHAISWRKAAIGARSSRSRWACWRRRNCSASTPTCLPPYRPKSARRSPVTARRPASRPTKSHAFERLDFFFTHGLSYAQQMGEPPADAVRRLRIHRSASPPGSSTTTLRSYELIARVFDGQTEGLTRDDVLDNITLAWLTNTAISGARLYWENKLPFFAPMGVAIPIAVSAFPDELYQAPRSWAERAYPKLIHYNRLPRAATSRPGNSRSSCQKRFARASDHSANRSEDFSVRIARAGKLSRAEASEAVGNALMP